MLPIPCRRRAGTANARAGPSAGMKSRAGGMDLVRCNLKEIPSPGTEFKLHAREVEQAEVLASHAERIRACLNPG